MWQLWVFTAPHELFLFALGDSLRWLLLLMSTYVGPVLSSLLFFPFGMGLPIRCLSHHCILAAHSMLVSQAHNWRAICLRRNRT